MDQSRYTQRVETSQIQFDLQNAVTDADRLLLDFKKEAVDELRNHVQTVVWQAAQATENRLNQTLTDNCNRAYQNLHQALSKENMAVADALSSQMKIQQNQFRMQQKKLEQKLRLMTILLIIFALLIVVAIVILYILFFRLK